MEGPAGVITLVLAQFVAGALAFLWLTPLWHEVKPGFFTLSGTIVSALALATWRTATAAAVAGSEAGRWSVGLTALTFVVTAIWTIAMYVRRRPAARAIGFVSLAASTGALVAMSATGRQAALIALFQLAAGAAFLGSVVDGLLLGHWYLTDRGLTRTPIRRMTALMIASIGVEFIAVLTSGFKGVGASEQINPLLTAGALAPWIALGMVATTGLIAGLVKAVLRGERASAVQSATGFFYLAVVTGFMAEVAVKTRFLPS